ncbi:MAG: radical SAM protein [bacterium]
MKILLINPPRLNEIRADNPSFIDEERGFNPPLGLLYLSGYLREKADWPVEVIDAQAEELAYDAKFKARIPTDDDLVVGITAMTFTMIDVVKTIGLLKEVAGEKGIKMKIVLGGPHPTIYPKETINLPGVDYAIIGEGEITFLELCRKISQNEEPLGVKGVVFKQKGEIVNNGWREFVEQLDQLPFPARELVDINKYNSILSGGKIITTMITSRGCPFQCAFCDRPHLGKKFRYRSAQNVVAEMAVCQKLGIGEILVYDDTFTVNRQRVIDICEEIKKRSLKIDWDIRARVDTVDEEILKKLKSAGCRRIHFGVEAGTDKILKVLKKGINIEQVKKIFKLCRRLKIKTLAYFMIGSPTETKEDIKASNQLARELKPDFIHATILTPYPATALYYQALEEGIIKNDYWRVFAQNPLAGVETCYWEKNFTRQELFDLLEKFYHQFYSRPSYIAKQLFSVRSWRDFLAKSKMGLKILGLKR